VALASFSWIAIMFASCCIITSVATIIWYKWFKKPKRSIFKENQQKLKEVEARQAAMA
jgi:hypothetical protein